MPQSTEWNEPLEEESEQTLTVNKIWFDELLKNLQTELGAQRMETAALKANAAVSKSHLDSQRRQIDSLLKTIEELRSPEES
jgi:hypothetical protein